MWWYLHWKRNLRVPVSLQLPANLRKPSLGRRSRLKMGLLRQRYSRRPRGLRKESTVEVMLLGARRVSFT
jgi:hypothetical protein